MLLRMLKANRLTNLFLVPVAGVLMVLSTLLFHVSVKVQKQGVISPFVDPFFQFNQHGFISVIIALAVTMLVCFLIMTVNSRFVIIRERTYLQSFIYILLVFSFPQLHVIQPVFFASIFIILAIQTLFASFDQKSTVISSFEAAMFISIAAFFYPYAIVMSILSPISLFVLQNKLGWREFFATLWGVLFPWIFIISIYFFFGQAESLFTQMYQVLDFERVPIFMDLLYIGYFGFFLLMILISSILMVKQYGNMKISNRRYQKVLFLFFLISYLMIFIPGVSSEILAIISIPVSFLFTNYLIFSKKRFWTELFFIVLVVSSLLMQFLIR